MTASHGQTSCALTERREIAKRRRSGGFVNSRRLRLPADKSGHGSSIVAVPKVGAVPALRVEADREPGQLVFQFEAPTVAFACANNNTICLARTRL